MEVRVQVVSEKPVPATSPNQVPIGDRTTIQKPSSFSIGICVDVAIAVNIIICTSIAIAIAIAISVSIVICIVICIAIAIAIAIWNSCRSGTGSTRAALRARVALRAAGVAL